MCAVRARSRAGRSPKRERARRGSGERQEGRRSGTKARWLCCGACLAKTKARANSLARIPGLLTAVAPGSLAHGLYACNARRCLVPPGSCMEPASASHRLFNCACCGAQVLICLQCDRGNQYCTAGCAPKRRRESMRGAAHRYQQTFRGRCCHAARQSALRERQRNKVTHQGSPDTGGAATVACIINQPCEQSDEPMRTVSAPVATWAIPPMLRCSVCRRVLSAFTRLRYLRS